MRCDKLIGSFFIDGPLNGQFKDIHESLPEYFVPIAPAVDDVITSIDEGLNYSEQLKMHSYTLIGRMKNGFILLDKYLNKLDIGLHACKLYGNENKRKEIVIYAYTGIQ